MASGFPQIVLARHGATEWSVLGRHTGRTDIVLTERGRSDAVRLGERLRRMEFGRVMSSPLQRARVTAEIAGYGDRVELVPDLMEWDYGPYEGLTAAEIRERNPGWVVFRDGVAGGELVPQAVERADRVVATLRAARENVLVFSHGHYIRLLAARWMGLPLEYAGRMLLGTAAVSILGYNHGLDEPSLLLWNDAHHLAG
ncbi:histidine phosphatase family protein [Tuwongella immobilis]|nr:histidine phosphatase family protein [Tuwongella immobilis]